MTFDLGTSILYTCDIFGMHYCSDAVYDEDLKRITPDYRFYYECLMAPNARSVIAAMKRMDDLPQAEIVANGHGPLLRYNIKELNIKPPHPGNGSDTTIRSFYYVQSKFQLGRLRGTSSSRHLGPRLEKFVQNSNLILL
jgi:hypothetical protein